MNYLLFKLVYITSRLDSSNAIIYVCYIQFDHIFKNAGIPSNVHFLVNSMTFKDDNFIYSSHNYYIILKYLIYSRIFWKHFLPTFQKLAQNNVNV